MDAKQTSSVLASFFTYCKEYNKLTIANIRLTGKFVFSGKNYKDILNKNTECIVPYPHQYWSRLSTQARDLVQNMLQKNPDIRLSAA